MKPYDRKSKKIFVTTLCILAGNALMAFLVAAFIIPHDIVMGGTTGIGIVLSRLVPQIDVAIFVLILNVILLFIGLFILGKKFFLTTVAGSVLYPLFLELFQKIPGIETLTDDPLLAALFAGCLMGVALGLVMRVGSSTGGMDVVTVILNKFFHLPIAVFVWALDILVVGGQALFISPDKTLLGIVVLVLESIVLDKAMLIGTSQIQLLIISEKYEEICLMLLSKIKAGVTRVEIETGLLRKKEKGVLCVIPNHKLYSATEAVQSIDREAFITITKINEVRGRGFTVQPIEMPVPAVTAEDGTGKDETDSSEAAEQADSQD